MRIRGLVLPESCLVDFRLSVKLDSISLLDICMESSICHTGFCSYDNDLIIKVHCSGQSASKQLTTRTYQQLACFGYSQGWLVNCTAFNVLVGVLIVR